VLGAASGLTIGLNAVIITVRRELPQVLTVHWPQADPNSPVLDALPFGPLDPEHDVTLERALLRWVQEQTGLDLDWVEQLYTFGDQHRNPSELDGGPRTVAVAYLVLIEAGRKLGGTGAQWGACYDFFPWEDWREGKPAIIDERIEPVLRDWLAAAPDAEAAGFRRERADIAFGRGEVSWDGDRVLDRFELLYELGLVEESHRDLALRAASGAEPRFPPWLEAPGSDLLLGRPMAHDHRRILATALGRLRGKLRYRPVVFELLPTTFTLLELQRVVESLAGLRLHKGNFRRLVERGGLVEGTGRMSRSGGRPAERFRFRREVLRERRAPGVGIPRRRR
jgi:hypothetical protein